MGYIFISYSSANKESAEAFHKLLSNHGFETWMAPNDIPPGSQYADVITKAIKGCHCFILLLTRESQESTWVSKEVERAIHYRKMILPISLDDVILNDAFEFYISTNQIEPVRTISEDSAEIKRILDALSVYMGQTVAPRGSGPETADPQEQYNLANCYMNGQGFPQDDALALQWYCKAAGQGHAVAQYCAGFFYEFGKGTQPNPALAVAWYTKSALQGHSWAQHRLGECYYYGKGVPCDYIQAFHWLKLSAEQNNAGAYPLLAECYEKGLGTPKNPELAFFWRNQP